MKFLYTDEVKEAMARWNGILPTPSKEALRKPKGLRVFKNPVLEFWIARAHPLLPGVWAVPLATYLLIRGFSFQSSQQLAVLFVAGAVFWTLFEYCIHLFLFHKKVTATTPQWVKDQLFMLHGYHHEYPGDTGRLVMPIIIAWPLALLIGTSLWFTIGPVYFYGFYSGVVLGYLGYDWMHFYTHNGRPTTASGKYLHAFHALHHYVDQQHNFGLSSPLWDWVLGSAREPKSPSKSKPRKRTTVEPDYSEQLPTVPAADGYSPPVIDERV